MKKRVKYPKRPDSVMAMKETPPAVAVDSGSMVRTQIYLSRSEHAFLQAEAKRRDQPMAAVIRNFIDEKMPSSLPDEAWTNNPMFKPWPKKLTRTRREDGSINHDFYVYGTPKRWMKREGRWIKSPPLPKDYYTNAKSRREYDELVKRET
jgi:hypothetical protein